MRPIATLRPQFCLAAPSEGGDCYRACVATVTGLDAQTMPNFQHLPGVTNGSEGLARARDWLRERGFLIFDMWVTGKLSLNRVLTDCSAYNEGIPIILSGWSDRGNGSHAVVVLDGQIIHDPSGAGVDRPDPCQCGEAGCNRVDWGLQVIVSTHFREGSA